MAKKQKVEGDGEAKAGGGKSKLLPAIVLAVGLIGGGYFMGGGKAAATKTPVVAGPTTSTTLPAGEVLALDPITLNLSDGHILRVGIALQLTKAAKAEEVTKEGPKALDLAIGLLGEKTQNELTAPGGRAKAKQELSEKVASAFEGEVLGIYFTDFVMQ